jgi:N-succinyldiaminopimelate aminotransferase
MRVGDGLGITRRLWRDYALKVLPGTFLTQAGPTGANEGDDYIRIALVHDVGTTAEGLSRLAAALGIAPGR